MLHLKKLAKKENKVPQTCVKSFESTNTQKNIQMNSENTGNSFEFSSCAEMETANS